MPTGINRDYVQPLIGEGAQLVEVHPERMRDQRVGSILVTTSD